ncbi:phosphotransferase [Kribbella sp. NBC_00382]|uniref:phosphotransferase enzyme family protein n=1 Tax=Kribbella sp. NBC_00382 TaxID=2975967 RepID=UPI002E23653E
MLSTLRDVTARLELTFESFEETRPADADSVGNGNWLGHTPTGQCLVLRRYHVLRTEADLAYESAVLHHLTAKGWTVPTPVAGPVWHDGRLWAATRFVPGKPHAAETAEQVEKRGSVLARLHADLRELELGQRHGFFQGCDLEAMGAFQDWDPGVVALRTERGDLADWAEAAMAEVKQLVAGSNLSTLPQTVVHGDFAEWNLHITDDRLSGIIDFDLVHADSRSWEFVIARVHRSPGLLTGYQRTATELGIPLSEEEMAAIDPLQRVFRVNMVMAELWSGPRTGRFDVPMIERQLGRTGTPKP